MYGVDHSDAARAWGASGLAQLTGDLGGPPDFSRAAVLEEAARVAAAYRSRTGVDVDAALLLGGRAGLLGLARRGRASAGGATRLCAARDGWWALTLSRQDDVDVVPALIESDAPPTWEAIEWWSASRAAADVVERARLLGLPAAVLGEYDAEAIVQHPLGEPVAPRTMAGLLVVDMSSMWAGPLCGQLLLRAGATVVKVETLARPDGTRAGPTRFFDWMNSGKLSYAADFKNPTELRELLGEADVVIESSRIAALALRGLGAHDITPRAGRVWLRVSGYGSAGDRQHWVAFGDDAAVAGGLVGTGAGGPVFCGDAIADPLTGLHAALAVVEAVAEGGGRLVEVAMAGVAARYAALPLDASESSCTAALPPVPLSPPAAAIGQHNADVAQLIGARSRC